MAYDLLIPAPTASLTTEVACIEYLYQLKWPNGFSCPTCGHWKAYRIRTRRLPLFQCAICSHQTSLIAGTVMEGSRTPLTKWFIAIQLVANPLKGISALTLSSILRVTYKTAWSMLQKIRFAMGKFESSEPLSGEVTINDASYGRPAYCSDLNLHHRETPVLLGAELTGGEPIRLAVELVPPKHLYGTQVLPIGAQEFIKRHVSRQAEVRDCQIKRYGPRKLKKALPLFRQATKWMNQTFHGLGRKHLQAYLHEFCCRINLQLAAVPIFDAISLACTSFGTITYRSLVARKVYFVA